MTCIPFTFPLREVGGTPEATVVVLAAGRFSGDPVVLKRLNIWGG